VGERFKESVFINSGLLSLGNVISALADSKKKVKVKSERTATLHCCVYPRWGGIPLYGLYRYVRPQKVWFFSRFGHKYSIDFGHFGHK